MTELRPAAERGHANHGWLDSYHSFSFAGYQDPRHMGFGPLRVINEDRVAPGSGFGTHGRMSAGQGVLHSEYNDDQAGSTHFLQIWIEPDVTGIAPSYEQKHFPPEEKRGRLRLIASPDGRVGSVGIHQDALLYAGLFDGVESAKYSLEEGRKGYVHVARGAVQVNGHALRAGDALKTDAGPIEIERGEGAEVLVFDLPGDRA